MGYYILMGCRLRSYGLIASQILYICFLDYKFEFLDQKALWIEMVFRVLGAFPLWFILRFHLVKGSFFIIVIQNLPIFIARKFVSDN